MSHAAFPLSRGYDSLSQKERFVMIFLLVAIHLVNLSVLTKNFIGYFSQNF